MKRTRTIRSMLDLLAGEDESSSLELTTQDSGSSRSVSTSPESDITFMDDILEYFDDIHDEEGMGLSIDDDDRPAKEFLPLKTRKLSHREDDDLQRSSAEREPQYTSSSSDSDSDSSDSRRTCPMCSSVFDQLAAHLCPSMTSAPQDDISSLSCHFISLFRNTSPTGKTHFALV